MKTFFLLTTFFISFYCFGQPIKHKKKDLRFLDSVREIAVIFVYDSLTFDGDHKSETVYLKKRKARLDREKKMPSETWLQNYEKFKTEIWPEQFVTTLNTLAREEGKDIVFSLEPNAAKTTLLVIPNWMYMGYDVGVVSEPAKLSLDFILTKDGSEEKPLAKLYLKRASANNKNIDNENKFQHLKRMENAFRKSAFSLFAVLKKYVR